MAQNKKKPSGSRGAVKKTPPLGLAIVLAAAGGVVVGSAGTYVLMKPLPAAKESTAASASAVGGPATPTPAVTMSPPPPRQPGLTPQPPGPVPPGKVWSPEHGHWHDLPGYMPNPAPAPATPVTIPVPATPTAPTGRE